MGGGYGAARIAQAAARRRQGAGGAFGKGGLAGGIRFAMPAGLDGHVLVPVDVDRLDRALDRRPGKAAPVAAGAVVSAPRVAISGNAILLAAGGDLWDALKASGARTVPVAVPRGQVTRFRRLLD